jgi:hypothetical protein
MKGWMLLNEHEAISPDAKFPVANGFYLIGREIVLA